MSCDNQVVERLSDLVSSFICHSAGHLPDDVKTRLAQMKETETEGFAPSIYDVMEKNMEMADKLGRPSCQDTGLPQFFAKVGTGFPYLEEIEPALVEAVKKATVEAPLRHNAVEVFDEVNTGNNVAHRIPWIDWELVPGSDKLELYFYMAGGGCSLPGFESGNRFGCLPGFNVRSLYPTYEWEAAPDVYPGRYDEPALRDILQAGGGSRPERDKAFKHADQRNDADG